MAPVSNSSVEKDTTQYRALLNQVAQSESVGFRFTETDQGLPGIDAADVVIVDEVQAAPLNLSLDANHHPSVVTSDLAKAIATIRHGVEKRRQQAVKQALDPTLVAVFTPEISAQKLGLTGSYQQYYALLKNIEQEAAHLQVLERDLRGLERFEAIKTVGTPDDQALFLRQFSIKGCGPFVTDPFCSASADYALADPNSTLWPDGFTDADLKKFEANAAMMSPYTVVTRREGDGAYETTSYPQFEPYRRHLLTIADEFEAIAQLDDIDEASKNVAAAYARACRGQGKNPLRPFDEAEEVWATTPSPVLTFSFGPFEEQRELDGFGIKRGFQMVIYRVREEMTAAMQQDRPMIAELNRFLRGREVNVPSRPERAQTIHLADIASPSVRLSNGHANAIAQTIPNDGPVVESFGRRVDVGVNMAEAVFDRVMVPIRNRITAPDQRANVVRGMMAKFAELHELSHSAGFLMDDAILKDGVPTKLADAMGPIYFLLDEGKANAGAIVGIGLLKDAAGRPVYTKRQIADFYITYTNNLLRQIRQAPEDPHTWGARAELGSLFRQGAVELKEGVRNGKREKYFFTNVARMPTAMGNFFKEIVETQASGKREAAKAFLKRDAAHIPAELAAWVAYPRTAKGRLNDVPMNVIVAPPDYF